jgi:hypothetical protein
MAWKSPSSPRSREDEDAPSWSEPFRHAAVRQAVSEIEPEERESCGKNVRTLSWAARGFIAPVLWSG